MSVISDMCDVSLFELSGLNLLDVGILWFICFQCVPIFLETPRNKIDKCNMIINKFDKVFKTRST